MKTIAKLNAATREGVMRVAASKKSFNDEIKFSNEKISVIIKKALLNEKTKISINNK